MCRKYLSAWTISLLLCFLLAFRVNVSFGHPSLNVTVATYRELVDNYPYVKNCSEYTYRELVNIRGNVTSDGRPVEEGLVAIQVKDPNKEKLTIRTVPVGSTPLISWDVQFVSFYSCDINGNPKKDFKRGYQAYLYVKIKNTKATSITALLTISVVDADETTLGLGWQGPIELAGNGILGRLFPIIIPEWASLGTGTVYANVYTDWPENQGCPIHPEKAINFDIEYGSEETYQEPEISNGTYQACFRLPPDAPSGKYNVSVSAWYKGFKNFETTTFAARAPLLEDLYLSLGDVNLDYKINIYDVVLIASVYGSKSGHSSWNPRFDLSPDGEIRIYDVVIVTSKYGATY